MHSLYTAYPEIKQCSTDRGAPFAKEVRPCPIPRFYTRTLITASAAL